MSTEFKHKNINQALVAAQKEIGSAVKGAKNPFFNSNYADLGTVIESIKGPLNDNGLALVQNLQLTTNTLPTGEYVHIHTLQTTIYWEGEVDGKTISSSVLVPDNKDIQKWGASVTYLKRYALQALLLVPTADDDGELLMDRPPVKAAGRFKK